MTYTATTGVLPSIDDRSMLSYFLQRSMELIFARQTPAYTPVSGENDFHSVDCLTRCFWASTHIIIAIQISLFSQTRIFRCIMLFLDIETEA